jgi:hypothetical protein
MGVQLTIELGNDAFEDGNRDAELARIIRDIADKIESRGPDVSDVIKAYDINGNPVGSFEEVSVATNPDDSSFVILHIEDLGNAAFEDAGPAFEVARIFREAATRIENGNLDFKLYDVNGGSAVGSVSSQIAEPEAEEEVHFDESTVEQYSNTPVYGDKAVDRFGNEWIIGAVSKVEHSDQINMRTGMRQREIYHWLLSQDDNNTVVQRAEPDLLNGLKENTRTLEYVIDMDERGEFAASVREQTGAVIYRIDGFQIFEDGFMRNSKDIGGLADYLKSLRVIGDNDSILDTNRFQEWERRIDGDFERALALREKESTQTWYGTITVADSQRALLQSIGTVLVEDPEAKRAGDQASYLVRMDEAAHVAFAPFVGEFTADLHAITEYEVKRVEPDQHDDAGLAAHIAYLKFEAVGGPDADKAVMLTALKSAQEQAAERAKAASQSAPPNNDRDHGNEP